MKTKDIPSNIPRNICNNFLQNNTFNYDSFALENKTMLTKDIPSNIPRNIPRNIWNNFLKNKYFQLWFFCFRKQNDDNKGYSW